MTEQDLMLSIYTNYGVAIAAACQKSSVPPSFLGALIANESGGNRLAKRFEKAVLIDLWNVLLGRAPAYGSIGALDLKHYVAGTLMSGDSRFSSTTLPPDAFNRLDSLATSWGLTQIMGYEVFDFASVLLSVDKLQTIEGSLQVSILMLARFAQRFSFDLATDAKDLFDCWNTGRPHAQTFDPAYIPNGLARMKLYQSVADSKPSE